jgi:hypothetical protein
MDLQCYRPFEMKLAKLEHLEKLRESGPRKKDRQYWEISKKDINQSNYNIWLCWMSIVIDYIKKRAKRSAKVRNSVSVNFKNSEA